MGRAIYTVVAAVALTACGPSRCSTRGLVADPSVKSLADLTPQERSTAAGKLVDAIEADKTWRSQPEKERLHADALTAAQHQARRHHDDVLVSKNYLHGVQQTFCASNPTETAICSVDVH